VIWSWLRRVHRYAGRTLVPSSVSMAQLESQGIQRLAMWRRGVDTQRFDPQHRNETLRARLAPNGEVIVGYIGRLAGDKRVHLLEHLADLPGTKLVIVGDGPAAAKLKRRIPNAVFPGFLGGQELSELYASLDVFVHTGADETFFQAVQEAMASGVSVVAPAAGGPLDLVEQGRTGLLYAPESVDELRGAVWWLASNVSLRTAYGARARATVVNRTWATVCDELLGHYTDLIATRAAGRHTTSIEDTQGMAG
jgi:phosphatidylinositol alpha 1,6-mannosyltransferase